MIKRLLLVLAIILLCCYSADAHHKGTDHGQSGGGGGGPGNGGGPGGGNGNGNNNVPEIDGAELPLAIMTVGCFYLLVVNLRKQKQ